MISCSDMTCGTMGESSSSTLSSPAPPTLFSPSTKSSSSAFSSDKRWNRRTDEGLCPPSSIASSAPPGLSLRLTFPRPVPSSSSTVLLVGGCRCSCCCLCCCVGDAWEVFLDWLTGLSVSAQWYSVSRRADPEEKAIIEVFLQISPQFCLIFPSETSKDFFTINAAKTISKIVDESWKKRGRDHSNYASRERRKPRSFNFRTQIILFSLFGLPSPNAKVAAALSL